MLNKLFGNTENFEDESKTGPAEDAKAICDSIDYVIIKAAWEEYVRIKKEDASYDPDYKETLEIGTPIWKALEKLQSYKGDFSKFTKEDHLLLQSLAKGYVWYDDVIHILIDHHDDEEAGAHIFESHPDMHDVIPKEYDDNAHVIEVVIEVIRDYQWQLEHFHQKHHDAIERQLASLEGRKPELVG